MIINQALSALAAEMQPLNPASCIQESTPEKVSIAATEETAAGNPGEADSIHISSRNATIRENISANSSNRPAAHIARGLLEALKEQIGQQASQAWEAHSGINASTAARLLEE